MKLKLLMRSYFVLLTLILVWCVWSSSQAATTSEATLAAESQGTTVIVLDESEVPANKSEAVVVSLGLNKVLDRAPFLRWEIPVGIPLWQYIASLIYIFLAFYVSKLIDHLTRIYLKGWAARTQTKFDDLVLELINGPVKIVAFVILLHIGLAVFSWPEVIEQVMTKGLRIIVAISLTYMTLKFVDLVMSYWRVRAEGTSDGVFNDQLYPIIKKSLKVFVVVVSVMLTSQNLGLNITSLIASLSIGGLALGLAAQDTVANLFGAVAVFADKPFRIGDRIKLAEVDGVVETIGLRSTRVRNLDGHLITVPNKTMGNATITNITLRPNIKTVMNISITYDTPTPKVKQALQILSDVYKGHAMTHDVWISFNQFADSSLNILVIHWWNATVYKDYLAGMQEMNLDIKQKFDEAGISFAFPTRTLYLKQDSEFRMLGAADAAVPRSLLKSGPILAKETHSI
jgi:MscS family membrane protein